MTFIAIDPFFQFTLQYNLNMAKISKNSQKSQFIAIYTINRLDYSENCKKGPLDWKKPIWGVHLQSGPPIGGRTPPRWQFVHQVETKSGQFVRKLF